ncbi:Ti-type conjugative transfer relaxase TraA [Brucella anthropi]|uniref:Ti-type conjugative transfer relaxase TraA n=1 Tax=Brucella anthropi TaxID=529 RepID=UPI0021659A57|nr:Ti-type conjugative transfer relaxase TraA [Brucella anthropi]UVV70796.1 Ti-type conjugative transfer relaxase TraA [Brucella anthropi]
MAIYHLSMKPISRSRGRSAVAASAYRSASKLTNERDGITHDYTNKSGVEHAEIVLPEGVHAEWARDRSALWNAAELSEKRKDARVAREFEIALPHELVADQRLEATRIFAHELADRYGTAIDFAIHAPQDDSDIRNHHAHIMMTTRQVRGGGLADKSLLERENKWLLSADLPTTDMQLRDLRMRWEGIANESLARAGHDIRIDHRSHLERGLEIEPTEHMGVHATQMERRGLDVSRSRLDEDAARRNAELIRGKPEQVLEIITGEKSVFDRRDVARALHRYIDDDIGEFQSAFAKVMASPALVELQAESHDPVTGEIGLARYSTRAMVEIESGMIECAQRMHASHSHRLSDHHRVDRRYVEQAIGRQDAAIRTSVSSDTADKVERGELDGVARDRLIDAARLSDEQRGAIKHITGPERIAAVVGYAGAGKSTMLAAAREAWEAEGYRVHGAALSGKAAEGLEESSGIQSRTLASWDMSWQNDRRTLKRGDVFVIDEAAMVGSRQLARFIGEAEARGAKIVLVGDHEQLQAIGAGAPFRAITEEIGHAELSEIRRQRIDWQRDASVAFATHRTAEGLSAYRDRGNISFAETGEDARGQIVRDYLADAQERPDGTRIAMAHRRADVRAINDTIRAELRARANVPGDSRGLLKSELAPGALGEGFFFQTNDGKREFAPGDRIVFLENNRDLGVKNGMLGTVEHVEVGRLGAGPRIVARLDAPSGAEGRSVSVPMDDYQAVDHGYATTIHKNQGATVDRAYVLASQTMDRHLTYVAMTRHRDGVQLYGSQDEFSKLVPGQQAGQMLVAGRLVEHGVASFEHKEGNSQSYFVTLENDKGEQRTLWGVDLERAMKATKQAPEIGDRIGLQHVGSEPVRLPDGTETHRNAWKVQEAGELAYEQLERRLSRSGVKETTLDYTRDFAERRGIAEVIGIRSEIEIQAERNPSEWNVQATQEWIEDHEARLSEKLEVERAQDPGSDRLRQRQGMAKQTEPDRNAQKNGPQQTERRRGGMFASLKLNAHSVSSQESTEASWLQWQSEREGSLRTSLAIEGPTPDRPDTDKLAERSRRQSPLETAVDRYARAYQSIYQHQRDGLPVLDMQRQEMHAAGQRLEQVQDGMTDLMCSTLQHDPQTARAITELSGRKRVVHVIDGIKREKAALQDPNVRAERFVNSWRELDGQRQKLRGWQHDEARGKIERQMSRLAKNLERDPQAESIVRGRSKELGIGKELGLDQSVARALQEQITRGQRIDRGFGIEM